MCYKRGNFGTTLAPVAIIPSKAQFNLRSFVGADKKQSKAGKTACQRTFRQTASLTVLNQTSSTQAARPTSQNEAASSGLSPPAGVDRWVLAFSIPIYPNNARVVIALMSS
jgi:hypothetical protein